jgi:hypothetical protein
MSRPCEEGTPLPYTASPVRLLWSDLVLFINKIWALPGIFLPLHLGRNGPNDEFYLSLRNAFIVVIHIFLIVYQVAILVSLPVMVLFMIPALWILVYFAGALLINYVIVMVGLNGFRRILVSQVPVAERPGHDRECWFFINGIAAG